MDIMELYIIVAVIVVVAAIILYKRKKGEKEVPQGLQVFDENGNTIIDTTNRITKYLGSFTVPTNADSGTVVDSRLNEGDLWYTIKIDKVAGGYITIDGMTILSYPVLTKGDGIIYWNYPKASSSSGRYGVTVHYGVY